MDFTIQWWNLCEFLEKIVKILWISVSTIINYAQNLLLEIGTWRYVQTE